MFPLAAHPFRSAADWENLRVPVTPYGATPDVLMPVPCQTDWSLAPSNLKGPRFGKVLYSALAGCAYIIVRKLGLLEDFAKLLKNIFACTKDG